MGTVFKNFGAFMTYNAQSGTPFTRTDPEGQGFPVEDFGASRLPWFHRVTSGSRRASTSAKTWT